MLDPQEPFADMVEDGRLPIPPGGKKPNIQTNPLEGYSLSYRILKESDKTSDHLPPSVDYLVCDCWKRVQIERMKTAWDDPYMVPQKIFQFCKWHFDEPKDPKAPCHFGKLPIEIQELIWRKLDVCHLITCLVINRRWNVKITEMIWNDDDWKNNL